MMTKTKPCKPNMVEIQAVENIRRRNMDLPQRTLARWIHRPSALPKQYGPTLPRFDQNKQDLYRISLATPLSTIYNRIRRFDQRLKREV